MRQELIAPTRAALVIVLLPLEAPKPPYSEITKTYENKAS